MNLELDMENKEDMAIKVENTNITGCGNGGKHFFYRMLFIGFLALFSFSLYAQDTDNCEFWFVAPDASNKHDDRPVFLMITTGDRPATVTISMPKNPEFKQNFTDTIHTIQAYSYWKFEFKDAQMHIVENDYTKSGRVTNKGIHITSTSPVSAYYQIDGAKVHQKEIFTLKGKKAFGMDFYIPFQTRYGVSATYNEDAFRQIQIVAAEDNTWVTVDPKGQLASPDDPRGYIDNTSNLQYRKKKLMKGETLLWRAYRRTTTGLTGTRVTADKPIAVTLFEDCLQGTAGSIDPIGDQLVPTGNLGKNYIIIKGYSNGDYTVTDNVVVVAVENGTEVYLDNSLQTTLNAGDHWSYNLGPGIQGKQAYYVNASKPVYCMHQSAAKAEIGGALLPSLYSISGRRITFIKDNSLDVSSMFLAFRASAKDGFTLDGNPLPLNAQSANFNDWMYAKVDLKAISGMDSVCTIANSGGSFALGYFNGNNTGTSLYGYLSAYGTFSFGRDTVHHCGNSYLFDAPYALSYVWTLPDNSTSSESRLEAKKSGRYVLTVNQDPYLITDETYLKLQNFSHTLSAPEQLLVEKLYKFTIEMNPQKDPDNYFKTKFEWNFGEGASVVTSDQREAEVWYSTSGNKTISLKIWNEDALCDTTITRTIEILATPEVMYWKTNTENCDWNNVNNWAKDAAGQEPVLAVPSKYTRVYLPGNAAKYPSLKDDKDGHTDWTHYGQPEVKEIVFRYGSELHYQHKLKYEKAYVNYNWGYYANDGADADGQPKNSWENAKKLRRDIWHILATPLKSTASGDFSLAGHPFSWQKKFKATATEGVIEGDFSRAFPTNDIPITDNNNAIAIKMAGYQNLTGYRQENLEGLKGVVEIPYFENKTVAPFYPAHNYDALSRKSYFYYFDTKTLKLVDSPLGSMSREGEAYRFVYETNRNEPPASGIYEMLLNTRDLGNTREVMIGNPFFAGIDLEAFADVNKDKIDVDRGYKLLSDDGLSWQQKFFTGNEMIPAWKAFIVSLKQPNVSSLLFPLEAETAAFKTTRTSCDAEPADNALYVQVLKNGILSGDGAVLRNSRNAKNPEIPKMILPEGHEVPEIFFTASGGDFSYLIRNLKQDEKEIPIGVKTSDTHSRLSLEFRNIPAFTAYIGARVILVDNCLNVRQDLSLLPVYPFTQQASGLDRQYVDKNRFVLQLSGDDETSGHDDPENGIDITYRSGILRVKSDENINTVSVYDLYGRPVFLIHSINLNQYTHPVPLQGKLFVVRIKTVSGKVKVKKIMGN